MLLQKPFGSPRYLRTSSCIGDGTWNFFIHNFIILCVWFKKPGGVSGRTYMQNFLKVRFKKIRKTFGRDQAHNKRVAVLDAVASTTSSSSSEEEEDKANQLSSGPFFWEAVGQTRQEKYMWETARNLKCKPPSWEKRTIDMQHKMWNSGAKPRGGGGRETTEIVWPGSGVVSFSRYRAKFFEGSVGQTRQEKYMWETARNLKCKPPSWEKKPSTCMQHKMWGSGTKARGVEGRKTTEIVWPGSGVVSFSRYRSRLEHVSRPAILVEVLIVIRDWESLRCWLNVKSVYNVKGHIIECVICTSEQIEDIARPQNLLSRTFDACAYILSMVEQVTCSEWVSNFFLPISSYLISSWGKLLLLRWERVDIRLNGRSTNCVPDSPAFAVLGVEGGSSEASGSRGSGFASRARRGRV